MELFLIATNSVVMKLHFSMPFKFTISWFYQTS